MTVKMIYCLYWDLTQDIWSNILLRLQEFPWALLSGTPSYVRLYFTYKHFFFTNNFLIVIRYFCLYTDFPDFVH